MVKIRSENAGPRDGHEAPVQGETTNQDDLKTELKQTLLEMANQNRKQIKIIKLFEKSIKSLTRRERITKEKSCSFKKFMSCRPPEFEGSSNPITVVRWMNEMEQTFVCCGCSELQKVNYAVRMLKGRAWEWWNMSRKLPDDQEIVYRDRWDAFKVKLMMENVSEKDMQKIAEEFRTLKKGDLTVHEYACQFVEKMAFGESLVPHEEAKVNRFAMGLPWEYSHSVRQATTLSKAIEEAKNVEDRLPLQREKRILGEKKKWEGPSWTYKKRKFDCECE